MKDQNQSNEFMETISPSERRIRELEDKVESLERALKEAQPEPPGKNLAGRLWKILSLIIMFVLALIPSWLVFRDRWLFLTVGDSPFQSIWKNITLFREAALPAYFAYIILCLLVLIIWAVFYEIDIRLIFRTHVWTNLGNLFSSIPEKQLRTSRIFFYIFGISVFGSVLFGVLTRQIFGWGFLLAITAYIAGWVLREVSIDQLLEGIWANRSVWISFVIAQVVLVFFMRSLALGGRFEWGYFFLLFLAFVNLLRYFRRIPTILWIFTFAVILYLYRINSWAYSVIGDDFAFYNHALEIAETTGWWPIGSRLFDGLAVYGSHPYLSSLIQAGGMVLFGKDSFGWRFSSLYLSAIAIIFYYLFLKPYVNREVALIAAFLLASSSYIMTFGKIGYNNLQALFTMSLALAACAWAERSHLKLAYVSIGVSLGLCFYVYPAGLYVIPICVLFLLINNFPRSRKDLSLWGWAGLSLIICIIPLLLQPGYWTEKLPGFVSNNIEITRSTQNIILHFASNLLISIFSFLYIPEESHFVASGYLDAVSSIFYMLGLAFVIKWTPKNRFAGFLLAGLAVLLILVGASHDRRFPPTTRMFMFLPWFAIIAAIGITWFVEQAASLKVSGLSRRSILILVLIVIVGANIYQAYYLSPRRSLGQQSAEVLYVRLLQRMSKFETRSEYPKTIVFLTDATWGIDGYLLINKVYDVSSWQVNLMRIVLDKPKLQADLLDSLRQRNTMIIVQPGLSLDWQNQLSTDLGALGKVPCEVKEYSGRDTRFIIWLSTDLVPLCDLASVY